MILVVSYAGEDHTAAVVERLEAAGREVVRIDLGDFPARAGLAVRLDATDERHVVTTGGGPVDLRRAAVAWWRRLRPYTLDDALTAEGERAFALSETAQAVGGMLDALPCGRFVTRVRGTGMPSSRATDSG